MTCRRCHFIDVTFNDHGAAIIMLMVINDEGRTTSILLLCNLHSEFKSGKKYNFSDYHKCCPQRIKAIFLNFFSHLGVSRPKAQFCIQKYWENFLSTNMLILIFVVITNTVFFECLKSSSSLNYHNKCNKLVKVP